jgi:hypothetical protein
MISEFYIDAKANVAQILKTLEYSGAQLLREPKKLVSNQETIIEMLFELSNNIAIPILIQSIKHLLKGKKARISIDNNIIKIPSSKSFKFRRSIESPISTNEIQQLTGSRSKSPMKRSISRRRSKRSLSRRRSKRRSLSGGKRRSKSRKKRT